MGDNIEIGELGRRGRQHLPTSELTKRFPVYSSHVWSPDLVSGFVCVSHTKVATWLEVLLYLNVRALTKERPRTRPCGDVIGAATLLVPGKVWLLVLAVWR